MGAGKFAATTYAVPADAKTVSTVTTLEAPAYHPPTTVQPSGGASASDSLNGYLVSPPPDTDTDPVRRVIRRELKGTQDAISRVDHEIRQYQHQLSDAEDRKRLLEAQATTYASFLGSEQK